MASSSQAATRVIVGGVAALVVPMLHLSNRRRVAATSRVVRRTAELGSPLRRFAGDGLDARIVGHVHGASTRLRLGQTSCLARAQLAFVLLSWAGYSPLVKTGAQANLGKGGEAHAWVEVDGSAVGEDLDHLKSFQNLVTVLLP